MEICLIFIYLYRIVTTTKEKTLKNLYLLLPFDLQKLLFLCLSILFYAHMYLSITQISVNTVLSFTINDADIDQNNVPGIRSRKFF